MTYPRFAAVLLAFAGFVSPMWSYANGKPASQDPTDPANSVNLTNRVAIQDGGNSAPLVSVGVSDPNTQLHLPWFLTDIINTANAHGTPGDLLRTFESGF